MNEETLKFAMYLTGETSEQVTKKWVAYQMALPVIDKAKDESKIVQLFGKPHRKVVSSNGRVELFEV